MVESNDQLTARPAELAGAGARSRRGLPPGPPLWPPAAAGGDERPPMPAAHARLAAVCLALCLAAASAIAAGAGAGPPAPPRHDLVVIVQDGLDLGALVTAGYDVVGGRPGHRAEIVATAAEQDRLRRAGYDARVQQADLEAFYAAAAKGAGFGAYHTYSETLQELDDLRAAYPHLVSARFSLGASHEGNAIWAVRVSDNPALDEDEPEVLFDALHHAREVIGTETVLGLIRHLCESYATDADARRLLDEREIYCVPIVNPDGVLFNEANYPGGGGMWRKNRRVNGGGYYGVDLNRNYPYEWVGPGSSSDPSAETYRGPSAGSEPEAQALMAFHAAHDFQTYQSYHSYSNLTLIPWGFTSVPCPDDAVFRDVAAELTADNGYLAGSAPELLYVVNGSSVDWAYGETVLKPRAFAFSNEIGDAYDGFWPAEARLPELVRENLAPARHLIDIAGVTFVVRGPVLVVGGDGNGRLDPGESAALAFTVQQGAVKRTATGAALTLRTDDPYLTLADPQRSLGAPGPRATWSCQGAPLPVAVDAGCPDGHLAEITFAFAWDGGACQRTVLLPVGPATVLFQDDFESGASAWALAGTWGLTEESAGSPTHSLTDSPGAAYGNGVNAAAQLASPLDLTDVAEPVLSFQTRHALEELYDYGYVEGSRDGLTWQRLAGLTGTRSGWQERRVPLAAFAGESAVRLRLRLRTDTYVTDDGWYVDDLAVTAYPRANLPPSPPAAVAPAEGARANQPVTLTVLNAQDADGPGPLTYGFRVYRDALCTQLVAAQDGVPEGTATTSWTIPAGALDAAAKAPTTCHWRAFADDGLERGLLAATSSFVYDPLTGVALAPAAPFLEARPASGTGEVHFRFAARRPGTVRLAVYTLRGERVATLFAGEARGETAARWDRRDARGAPVASGLYLARLRGPDTDLSVKVTVVR